jgi:hypothetical protein
MLINMDLFVKSIVCCLASINKSTGRDWWNIKTELKILTFYLKNKCGPLWSNRGHKYMQAYMCKLPKKYE